MEIFWCSTKFLGLAQNVHLLSVWPKTFGPAHNILGPVEGPDINKWFILPFTQKICLLGDDVSKFPYDGLKKSCSDKIEMSFFKPTFPPKNGRTNSILLLWDLFLFGFWRKLKTPNRRFEIKWPLEISRQIIELLFGVTIVLLYSSWEGPGSKLKCKKRKITVFIKFAVLILQNRKIRPQDFGGSTASILPSNEANLRPQLWIYSKFSKALDRNCFLVYHETFFVVVLQITAFNTICIAWNLCKKIKLDWH